MTASNPAGPLTGIRVIELADCIGQWCGKLMADFGADVIKVEPIGGANERNVGPFYQDQPDPNRSLYFWHYNTSKRGVTLDLEQQEGRDLFRNLVASADVLLETMPPGRLPALGFDYASLSAQHPGLVMCSLTPFGQDGPWRDYRTTDMLHLAGGGQMAGCGYDAVDDPEQQPIAPGGGNGWHMGSHYAYIAIMSAIFHRDMTGEGQYLDVSVHEACALTTEMHVPTYIYTGQVVQRQTGRHAGARPSAPTQVGTADGRWINTGPVPAQRFKSVVAWMDSYGRAGDLNDPKYADPSVLEQNLPDVYRQVKEFVATLPAEEAFNGAQHAGLPWGAVHSTDDLIDDEHFRSRGFFPDVHHPELGQTFTYPGAAALFSDSPWQIYRRAPLIGEHNAEVFAELGVDAPTLLRLRSAGVV